MLNVLNGNRNYTQSLQLQGSSYYRGEMWFGASENSKKYSGLAAVVASLKASISSIYSYQYIELCDIAELR